MHLSKRDLLATGLVVVAVIVWLLRALDAALPGMHSVRASAIVVLALGFLASATAVVPTFVELLHGNRGYLAVTSSLGLVALVAGVTTLVAQSAAALGVVVGVTTLLWVIATVHHTMLNNIPHPTDDITRHPHRTLVTHR